jgi:acyl dehydratase
MTGAASDPLYDELQRAIGKPLGPAGPTRGPDPVNLPMIRHWVDALADRNPVYLDADFAARTRFGGIVAPPAMLQTWTLGRPDLIGIAERGGSAGELDPHSPLQRLADAGYTGTRATNSELDFERYLRIGDEISATTALESVSERKATGLGTGYFVTWVTTYVDARGQTVGKQRFRIFRFAPAAAAPAGDSAGSSARAKREAEAPAVETGGGPELPVFELRLTPTLVVAGALASCDFMPVHHDRDYAQSQGAPNIFLNILSLTGYVSRYVTDWAGPEAMLASLAIRLGAPSLAGLTLRFTGRVSSEREAGKLRHLELALRAASPIGDHAVGSAALSLPR